MISRTVCEECEASVVYHQAMLGYTKSRLDLTTSEVWMYIVYCRVAQVGKVSFVRCYLAMEMASMRQILICNSGP